MRKKKKPFALTGQPKSKSQRVASIFHPGRLILTTPVLQSLPTEPPNRCSGHLPWKGEVERLSYLLSNIEILCFPKGTQQSFIEDHKPSTLFSISEMFDNRILPNQDKLSIHSEMAISSAMLLDLHVTDTGLKAHQYLESSDEN